MVPPAQSKGPRSMSPETEDKARELALRIGRDGGMTRAEIARELRLSHQIVDYWLKAAKIDARKARMQWIKRYLKQMR
jgi:orotate phosphoribosyltransferase-like protein